MLVLKQRFKSRRYCIVLLQKILDGMCTSQMLNYVQFTATTVWKRVLYVRAVACVW